MHDCPTCKVPLHGHEEVCPSCGTKQVVRGDYRKSNLPPPPGVNPAPFFIAFAVVAVIGFFAVQNSWIFQAATHQQPDDPMAKLTPIDARSKIEAGLTQGLTAVGAKAKFSYSSGGQPSTKSAATPVELTVDTSLQQADQHKAIVDPIKDFMSPGKVSTLTFNDAKSHATWTYTAAINLAPPEKDDNVLPPDAGAGATQTETNTSSEQQ